MSKPTLIGVPQQPQQGPSQQIVELAKVIRQLQENGKQIVNYVNNLAQEVNQLGVRIEAIDAVAYAALSQHEKVDFKLDESTVERMKTSIEAVLAETARYRTQLKEAAAAAQNVEQQNDGATDTAKG